MDLPRPLFSGGGTESDDTSAGLPNARLGWRPTRGCFALVSLSRSADPRSKRPSLYEHNRSWRRLAANYVKSDPGRALEHCLIGPANLRSPCQRSTREAQFGTGRKLCAESVNARAVRRRAVGVEARMETATIRAAYESAARACHRSALLAVPRCLLSLEIMLLDDNLRVFRAPIGWARASTRVAQSV